MSRITYTTRINRSFPYLNVNKVKTFSKNVYEGECCVEPPRIKNDQKTHICFGNLYLSRCDTLKGRLSNFPCGLSSRNTFNNSSNIGLLPTNPALLLIPKRWKQCPAADRAAPPPATCTKTPTNLLPSSTAVLDRNIPQPRVIIVGAGLAGISAAYRLSQSGFSNFQIVEATDRPGGRIHSCWLGDVVGELGNLWISQASVANPLFALAVQENLLRDPLPWRIVPPPSETTFLSSDGRSIQGSIASPAAQMFYKILGQASSLFSMDVHGKGRQSLLDFFNNRLPEEMKNIPDTWRPDVSKVIWGLINSLKTRFGARACQLSSDMLGSTVSLPGGSVRVPLGLVGILGPLLKGIDSKCISYCKPVQGITWHGGNPRATVRFSGGDVLTADYVIATMSLGVLKSTWNSLFTPCLPESKVNAIDRVGFGTLNRIILKYAKPFWLPGQAFYRLSWSEKELQKKDSWTKGISVIENLPGTSNVLLVSIGHDEAIMSESCEDAAIAEGVTKVLRQFSGDSSLPYPSGIARSKWASEPYFRGSRSYIPVGTTVQDLCELAAPLPGPDRPGAPVVLFAGEAAAPGFAGMLASHLSGIREADRILALTKKFSGPPPTDSSK